MDCLNLATVIRDAIHTRQEISKIPIDALVILTRDTFCITLIEDGQFGPIKTFPVLGALGDFWKPSQLALDYKQRAIVLYSLEQNITVFRLKRKFDSIQEFYDCFDQFHQLIQLEGHCIWKVYFLKSNRLILVIVTFDLFKKQFVIWIYQATTGSDFQLIANESLAKEIQHVLHILSNCCLENSFFLLTDSSLLVINYFNEGEIGTIATKTQRLKDYLGSFSSNSLVSNFIYWKGDNYLLSLTKGDLFIANWDSCNELFSFKSVKKIEPSNFMMIYSMKEIELLFVIGEMCDGAIYLLTENGIKSKLHSFAYCMSPITDLKCVANDTLLISCGFDTQSNIRRIKKCIPTYYGGFTEQPLFGKCLGIWSIFIGNETVLLLVSFFNSSHLIKVYQNSLEDVSIEYQFYTSLPTINCYPLSTGKFIQITKNEILICNLKAGNEEAVSLSGKLADNILLSHFDETYLIIYTNESRIYIYELDKFTLLNSFILNFNVSLIYLYSGSIYFVDYDGTIRVADFEGRCASFAQLDGESLVNSMLNFEGSFYCATRDGFLVRFFKTGLLVTSKKVLLSSNPLSLLVSQEKLLVNDRNNSVWSVFVYEEDFLCIPMYFDSSIHLLFPLISPHYSFGLISKGGTLSFGSFGFNRTYFADKMIVGKTVRRFVYDEIASLIYFYSYDGEDSFIKGLDTTRFIEQLKQKVNGQLTALNVFSHETNELLCYSVKHSESQSELHVLTMKSKMTPTYHSSLSTSPSLYWTTGRSGSGGYGSLSDGNPLSSIALSPFTEVINFDREITAIKHLSVFSKVSCILISEGKNLHAFELPSSANPTKFLNSIGTFSCRNMITCLSITKDGLVFCADSRDGIFALTLNQEEGRFDVICIYSKLRLISDILIIDNNELPLIQLIAASKNGTIQVLNFNGVSFQLIASGLLNEIPIRMTVVNVTIPASSVERERQESQIVIGTASGNLWTLTCSKSISTKTQIPSEIENLSLKDVFISSPLHEWSIY